MSYRDINAIKGRVEGMFVGVGKLKKPQMLACLNSFSHM